ncbi:MAG: hypothetical protein JWO38_6793 [Gemmataceae bacterium]|nr:hypothetical protein [Gemmataceae bacterium]
MEDSRRFAALRVCDYDRRGIFTADEACKHLLFFCTEPPFVGECVQLLPTDLGLAVADFLPMLPSSDEEWADYEGVGQLDGDERSWAKMIAACRAGTEAARAHFSGFVAPGAAAGFMDRVRAAYRDRMARYPRVSDVAEPVAAPDPARQFAFRDT